jgi:Ca-activated chloride channel homolog
MTFAQPLYFWLFALFPLLAALFFRNERQRARLLDQLVAPRLRNRLAGSASVTKRRLRFTLLMLGAAAAVVAMAQPRWGYTWQERKQVGHDVIIAIDVSRSMLANDIAPTRLARTKLAAEDLLAQLRGSRVGLVAFAGVADLATPLTADFGAVVQDVRALAPLTGHAAGGTNIAAAIRIAAVAFGKGESDNRALVIFSDGEELDADGVTEAESLKGKVRIFTVGVGSPEGTVIALPGAAGRTEYVKTPGGEIVKSRLDEDRLRAIAEAADGFYLPLSGGREQMLRLAKDGITAMSAQEIESQPQRKPIERYQWPLAVSIALLAASMLPGERRRAAGGLAAALLFALAPPASAKNPGVEAYEQGDYPAAIAAFSRQLERRPDHPGLHFGLGTAAFKAGDFDKALSAFSKAITSTDPALRAKAEYNLANTLAQRGLAAKEKPAKLQEWRDAIAHYEEALRIEPANENAKFNRDAVRQLIEHLEKEEPEQKKNDQAQPPKKPSEAAKKAKAEADAAVLQREYRRALEIMENQRRVDDTTDYYADYMQRLREVDGVTESPNP